MRYRFGNFELEERTFALRREGVPIPLQPKVQALLAYLIRNRERVVPKEELLAAVWEDTSVTESSLTRAVSLARLAIEGGSAAIVNAPRRGYRFEAVVEAIEDASPRSDPSPYVGRVGIRKRLLETLDAALAGRGRVLLLVGEAGIGKTRTAELLATHARGRGALVLVAGPASGTAAHRPWSQLLGKLAAADPRALAPLARADRATLDRLLSDPDPEPAAPPAMDPREPALRGRLEAAARALLAGAAASRPLALVLDDLHAADAEAAWLLDALAPAIAELPIAIVATCREEDAWRSESRALALERLARATAVERWPLTGLAPEEIRELVALTLGDEPDPALLAALARQTNGNPLLLRESLRSLEVRGLLAARRSARAWDELLPAGIHHLLAPKLRRCSEAALDLLRCAAACGIDVERALLARCARPRSSLEDGLAELADAGLLLASPDGARLRFPHVLVREAVHAELTPPGDARRAVHARIAAALEADAPCGDRLEALAHHAVEAVPRVAAARAAGWAQAAATHAAQRLDFESAAGWCERALALLDREPGEDPSASVRIWLALGDAQVHSAGVTLARVAYRQAADRARALGLHALLARAALGVAHRPNASGHGDPEVIALLEEALARAPAVDEAISLRVRSRLAAELRYADPARARAMSDEAAEAARRRGEASVLAQVLDDASFVRGSSADPEGWIALNVEIVHAARAAGDLPLELLGQKGHVTGLLELGDRSGVDRELPGLERTAAALATPYARWLARSLRAAGALLDGLLATAERHVLETIEPGAQADSPDVALELHAQLAYLRLEQGRAAEIESAAREQMRRFPGAPAWRAVVARVLVAAGRRAEAAEVLGQLARHRFRDVPRDRGMLPTLAMASEVAFAVGDERAAEALAAALAPHARLAVVAGSGLLYYGPVAHHLGLALAAGRHWEASIDQLGAALAAEERAGAPLWQERTRLAWAQVLLARDGPGDRARAVQLATEAERRASARGWPAVAAEAHPLASVSWRGPEAPRARGRRRRAPGP